MDAGLIYIIRIGKSVKKGDVMTNEEYIAHNGTFCPECGSKEIHPMGELFDTYSDGVPVVTREVKCFDCHKRWYDIFALTAFNFVQPPLDPEYDGSENGY